MKFNYKDYPGAAFLPSPSLCFPLYGQGGSVEADSIRGPALSSCTSSPGPGPPVYQVPISFPLRPAQTWQEALPSCTVTLLLPAGLTLLGTRGCRRPSQNSKWHQI